MKHPYSDMPPSAFWKSFVSNDFDASTLVNSRQCFLTKRDKIFSAGSCFASNLIPYLNEYQYTYIRTEKSHPRFRDFPNYLGYETFSAAYGNIYNPRHFLQIIQRAKNLFSPTEKFWYEAPFYIDPFRPGLRFNARSLEEFEILTEHHLHKTLEALNQATVIIFTLGLTEAWESILDGSIYPACPGTIRGTFSAEKYRFKNFQVDDIVSDFLQAATLIRETNKDVRFILTVSPVPLVATATNTNVVLANMRSKSALRIAAEMICEQLSGCEYFPAYEIITGPQAPHSFFELDRRSVSSAGVRAVMNLLLPEIEKSSSVESPNSRRNKGLQRLKDLKVKNMRLTIFKTLKLKRKKMLISGKSNEENFQPSQTNSEQISRILSKIECDEALQQSNQE
jgi:hypothetical protein